MAGIKGPPVLYSSTMLPTPLISSQILGQQQQQRQQMTDFKSALDKLPIFPGALYYVTLRSENCEQQQDNYQAFDSLKCLSNLFIHRQFK
eukprot:scaffold381012_cov22-Prasinocladus_malaysianus.AAC.1